MFQLFFLFLILIPNSINASLNVNDSFIYEITKAGYYAKFGDNATLIKDYRFGSLECPIGTKVNATVEEAEPVGGDVKFIFYVENRSRIAFITANWLDISAVALSFSILYNAYETVKDFDAIHHLTILVLYRIRPFIHPDFNDYLNSPETLGDDIDSFFSKWHYRYPDIEVQYDYSEVEGILYFESWVGGKVNGQFGEIITGKSDYLSEISFGNNFHFAVNKDSGVVQGFGQQGWVKGTIDDKAFKFSSKIEYELEGYNLPKYQFGTFKDFTKTVNLAAILIPSISIPLIVVALIIAIPKIRKHRQSSQ